MVRNTKSNSKGFTIIEVLIVLAIAGLIMLIVFLAVPALQRNSRNTQIRNSAGIVLSGVNEFVTNNSGQMPTTITPNAATGEVVISGATGTSSVTSKVQGGYVVSAGTAMPTAPGSIVVNFNHKCTNNAFSTTVTNRAVAAGFVIETASGTPPPQCVES